MCHENPDEKKDPRLDWQKMDRSLTLLDWEIIEGAVKGERARNARAVNLSSQIENPKIA